MEGSAFHHGQEHMSGHDSEVHFVYERCPVLGQAVYLVHGTPVLSHQVFEQKMILLARRSIKEFGVGGGGGIVK